MRGKPVPGRVGTRRGRALHLIDIENLTLGSSGADPLQTLGLYLDRAAWKVGDIGFVSGPAGLLTEVWNDSASFRPRWIPAVGPDAADLALLAEAPREWVVNRFDRLVVGSGDHIFAPLLSWVSTRGLQSMVVARRGTISLVSRMAAGRVEELDEFIPARRRETTHRHIDTGITVA